MTVKKAIFPAAGLGTRFLPATKAQPKEMFPLANKPVIQYGVEEAIASGMSQICMITGKGKRAIVDHFDTHYELVDHLSRSGKLELLKTVRWIEKLSEKADIVYIHQKAPKGLGDAVLTARGLVGDEPFTVVLADDVIVADPPCLQQMVEVYNEYKCNVLACRAVSSDQISRYGIIKPGERVGNVIKVENVVEKPKPSKAPSNLAIIGRYIFQPEIFDVLANIPPGVGGEIQLTDAINVLASQGKVVALEFEGEYYDTGTPAGFMKANIALAMKDESLRNALLPYLKELVSKY